MTIQEIKDMAKDHPLDGKQTILEGNNIVISIVGGRPGLYGDFENDFEIAIIDSETREFITKKYFPELNDDVMGYMTCEETEKIVNDLLFAD